MSVSTPILTTSSEICASAAVEASIAAANVPSMASLLAIIFSPSWTAHWPLLLVWRTGRRIGPICNHFEPRVNASLWLMPRCKQGRQKDFTPDFLRCAAGWPIRDRLSWRHDDAETD